MGLQAPTTGRPQLYVREGRRMRGAYVLTQADVLKNAAKPDPIAVVSFPIDSHDCQRVRVATPRSSMKGRSSRTG